MGLIIGGSCATARRLATAPAGSSLSLITENNFEFLGSFTAPTGSFGTSDFFSAIGLPVYNPAFNSLFMQGNSNAFRVAEMVIPSQASWVKPPTAIGSIPAGTVRQNFGTDPSQGLRDAQRTIDGNNTGKADFGGFLIRGSELIMSYVQFYDVSNLQSKAHWRRPIDLAVNTGAVGCFGFTIPNMPTVGVNAKKAGYYSGYMCEIPAEWQSALGGTAIMGNSGYPDPKRLSTGPSAFSFDPDDLASTGTPATCLLTYIYQDSDIDDPIWGVNNIGAYGAMNPYWNAMTHIKGAFIPSGNRSIIFVGDHGLGDYCYGTPGGVDPEPDCPDEWVNDHGPHMPPYIQQFWSYDLDDLVAVKAGDMEPWEPVCSIWNLSATAIPTIDPSSSTRGYLTGGPRNGGCAWDDASRILYVCETTKMGSSNFYRPVFNAFHIAP